MDLVALIESDACDLDAILERSDVDVDVERQARSLLDALPVPLHADCDPVLVRTRERLEWVSAELAWRRGDASELSNLHQRAWHRGGSPVPWLELLIASGERAEAALWARLIGRSPHVSAELRVELMALAHRAARTDEAWRVSLARFGRAPTAARWRSLVRFCDDELAFERTQLALAWLRDQPIDHDAVFLAMAPAGITSQLVALVEDGLVAPTTVEQNLDQVGEGPIGATLLLSAALGAQVRGDELGVARLVRRALACNVPMELLEPQLEQLRWEARIEREGALGDEG